MAFTGLRPGVFWITGWLESRLCRTFLESAWQRSAGGPLRIARRFGCRWGLAGVPAPTGPVRWQRGGPNFRLANVCRNATTRHRGFSKTIQSLPTTLVKGNQKRSPEDALRTSAFLPSDLHPGKQRDWLVGSVITPILSPGRRSACVTIPRISS